MALLFIFFILTITLVAIFVSYSKDEEYGEREINIVTDLIFLIIIIASFVMVTIVSPRVIENNHRTKIGKEILNNKIVPVYKGYTRDSTFIVTDTIFVKKNHKKYPAK